MSSTLDCNFENSFEHLTTFCNNQFCLEVEDYTDCQRCQVFGNLFCNFGLVSIVLMNSGNGLKHQYFEVTNIRKFKFSNFV